MQKVIVKIMNDGTTTIEGAGIKGVACSLHTQPFVAALGKIVSEKPTSEQFEVTEQSQVVGGMQ